jgi:hypothetical protein
METGKFKRLLQRRWISPYLQLSTAARTLKLEQLYFLWMTLTLETCIGLKNTTVLSKAQYKSHCIIRSFHVDLQSGHVDLHNGHVEIYCRRQFFLERILATWQ